MTDEAPPPQRGAELASQAGLRASHVDRDRAVELLRVAAGDGRLTAEELDERPEAALTARTYGELAALTTDRPAIPDSAPGALGGPAVIVGHSISGGAATVAAATRPDLVAGIVEINPFTRKVHYSLGGLLRVRRYRQCVFPLGGTQLFRSLRLFMRYLNLAYPAKPADYSGYMASLAAKLREPGRMAEFMKTFNSPADAEKQLPNTKCPALVIMGTLDPDFAGPQAEGDAIVAAMPTGAGTAAMVDDAGHYPHAQSPEAVAELVIPFLTEHAGA